MAIGVTLLQDFGTNEEENLGHTVGITANPAGTQAAATQLTTKWNQIDTAIVPNASVKLPAAVVGRECIIYNNSSNVIRVYSVGSNPLVLTTINPQGISAFRSPANSRWGLTNWTTFNE